MRAADCKKPPKNPEGDFRRHEASLRAGLCCILQLQKGGIFLIDFHSHILPRMDDGADNLPESLSMLRRSFLQGVDLMVATSHFYADQEYPRQFLQRRKEAFQRLQEAVLTSADVYPNLVPGAEVLYFPGISQSEDVALLTVGNSGCILVEPPMIPWTDEMLDEIVFLGKNFDCTPVIAHVDRFMVMLHDKSLIQRVRERDMIVQVNTEYFLNPKTRRSAVRQLKKGEIQLLGSDCHNMTSRPPNMGQVKKLARDLGVGEEFKKLHQNAAELLLRRGKL